GSAAQSTLIQVYDEFLGVKHEGHGKEFLVTMREYMPGKHREYLEMVSNLPSLKDYVGSTENDELKNIYNDCLKLLTKFRDSHLNLVHHYIMKHLPVTKVNPDVGTTINSDVETKGSDDADSQGLE